MTYSVFAQSYFSVNARLRWQRGHRYTAEDHDRIPLYGFRGIPAHFQELGRNSTPAPFESFLGSVPVGKSESQNSATNARLQVGQVLRVFTRAVLNIVLSSRTRTF